MARSINDDVMLDMLRTAEWIATFTVCLRSRSAGLGEWVSSHSEWEYEVNHDDYEVMGRSTYTRTQDNDVRIPSFSCLEGTKVDS